MTFKAVFPDILPGTLADMGVPRPSKRFSGRNIPILSLEASGLLAD
jgi:hypothetical protein